MKRFILLSLIVLCPLITNAVPVGGPRINYKGEPCLSGKSIYEWFSLITNDSWQMEYFKIKNKALIEWELEKFFKKSIKYVDFFKKNNSFYTMYVTKYLFSNPPSSKEFIDLMGLFYLKNKTSPKLLIVLVNTGEPWKSRVESNKSTHYPLHYKTYSKEYKSNLKHKKVNLKGIRKKAYDKYMARFRQSTVFNDKLNDDWVSNWNRLDIIRDILKQKALTSKNFHGFINSMKYMKTIPNDVAENIILFLKYHPPTPGTTILMLRLVGKNQKLTKVIWNNFKAAKKNKSREEYALAAQWIQNPPEDINLSHTNRRSFLAYASMLGDYNKAFDLWLKAGKHRARWNMQNKRREIERFFKNAALVKKLEDSADSKIRKRIKKYRSLLKNPAAMEKFIEADYNFMEGGLILLLGNSNLNMEKARYLLKYNSYIDLRGISDKPNIKFAKLIKKKHCKNVNSIGTYFPFESLTPDAQKTLFKTYTSRIMAKHNIDYAPYFKRIAHIKSPEYRIKILKMFMPSSSSFVQKMLQGISAMWLPSLLQLTKSKDPILVVNTCRLIATTSLYGKTAVKTLRNLLETRDDFTIKIAAICALAEIGDKPSIPLLKKYYNNKNRLLARAAKQAVYILQPIDKNAVFFKKMLQTNLKRYR